MHPLELRLVALLEANPKAGLADIGGLGCVENAIHEVASSRLMPEFLRLLIEAAPQSGDDSNLWNSVVTLVEGAREDVVVSEAVEMMYASKERPAWVTHRCFQSWLNLSRDLTAQPTARAFALDGAFRFGEPPARRFTLLGRILETEDRDDPSFLRHAAKIAGVAYSFWRADGLKDLLEKLTTVAEAADEAAFERGMAALVDALDASAPSHAEQSFSEALHWFESALSNRPGRPDAELFVATLDALSSFSRGEPPQHLTELTDRISAQASSLIAWHSSADDPPWLGARFAEAACWHTLSARLARLADHLEEPSWYEAPLVIEQELLAVYTASRSILRRDRKGHIDEMLAPRLESALLKERGQFHALLQWLERNPTASQYSDGKRLRENVEAALAKRAKSGPFEAVTPDPTVAASGILKGLLPDDASPTLMSAVASLLEIQEPFNSPEVPKLLEECAKTLIAVEDYSAPLVRRLFNPILLLTLRFLVSRMDMQVANAPERDYLFKQPNDRIPLEKELRDDYHGFMAGCLGDRVQIERGDIAGGRADVYFSIPPHQIVVEVKREERNCSFDSLLKAYGGQAFEYQATNVKLGLLLVLDLTPKPGGMAGVAEQVQAHVERRSSERFSRGLVIVKVPANRVRPSAVRLQRNS